MTTWSEPGQRRRSLSSRVRSGIALGTGILGLAGLAACSTGTAATTGSPAESSAMSSAAPAAPSVPSETPTPTTPRTPATPPPVVRLAFAGDTYAEGPLESRLVSDPDGFVGPFAKVFRAADVAMLNLETAVATVGRTVGTAEPKAFNFATTSAILPALRKGGIDVVSMANNHGMDFGYPGMRDSLRAKEGSKDPVVIGIGRNEEDAYAPFVADVRGQRIAFFTASQVLDPHLEQKWTAGRDKPGLASAHQIATLTERIRRVRPEVDTVVAFIHWGIEGTTCPTGDQINLTRRLKKAGADVIVGGGAHRIAGGGMMGNSVVAYGLGNFLFQAASAQSDRTGVFLVDVRGRDIVGYRWLPGRIVYAVPQPLAGAQASSELAYWNSLRSCTGLRP